MSPFYLLAALLGLLLLFFGPFAELVAQSTLHIGFTQLMHFSSNRLFVWGTFIPRPFQTAAILASTLLAALLLSKNSQPKERVLSAATITLSLWGMFHGDVVAITTACTFLIFSAVRSSPVLNLFGLMLAPQLALVTRGLSALHSARRPTFGILATVMLASFGIALFAPDTISPRYPALSHVVPTFGVLFKESARIGYSGPIEFSNIAAEQSGLLIPGILLLLSSFLSTQGRNVSRLLGIVVILDCLTRPALIYLSPLRAACRVLPTYFELPVVSIICGLAFAIITVSAVVLRSRWQLLLLVVWQALIFVLPDPLSTHGASSYLALFRSPSLETFVRDAPGIAQLNTPSLYPIYLRGLANHKQMPKSCFHKFNLEKVAHSLTASSNIDSLTNLADGRSETRWTGGQGQQIGNEWLSVRFSDGPRKLIGIQPMTGHFFTDYPRGIEIRYAESCEQPLAISKVDQNSTSLIFSENPWEGELAFTSDGYPYFREERYTQVLFAKPILAQCLLIRQIGRSNRFDWSVTDVRFIEPVEGCISGVPDQSNEH